MTNYKYQINFKIKMSKHKTKKKIKASISHPLPAVARAPRVRRENFSCHITAKKNRKNRIKGVPVREVLYPLILHQDLLISLFRPKAARPIRPEPRSSMVAGSGTAGIVISALMKTISLKSGAPGSAKFFSYQIQ
jgi:hypothetical protein